MNVSVRPAGASDIDAVAPMSNAYRQFYGLMRSAAAGTCRPCHSGSRIAKG